MKHQICEVCGASLDFGERCDCENVHNALPAARSDKPCTSLDMPKAVSGETASAEIIEPAPMPAFIAEMISGLRAKR